MLKRIVWVVLFLGLLVGAQARTDLTWFFDTGNVTVAPYTFPSTTAVCLKDGTNCPSNGGGSSYGGWLLAASNSTGNYNVTSGSLVNVTAGENIIITRINGTLQINASGSASGDITAVNALNGLLGGGTSGAVNLYLNSANCTAGEFSTYNGSFLSCATPTGSSSGSGNVSGGGVAGTLTIWYNATQVVALSYSTLYGNISTNLGNWSADKASYYTITQINNLFNGQNNLSLSQIVANIQNWSQDRPNYVNLTALNNATICRSDGSNCPSGSGSGNVSGGGVAGTIAVWQNATQIVSITYSTLYDNITGNIGNWSSDKTSYYTSAQVNNLFNGQNNLSLAQIATNIGNYSADRSILAYDNELAWQNSSNQVTLRNNLTNISLNFGSFFINLAQNRTGIGIPNPGSALDVAGILNATTLLQAGKSVCLGDGTNCPAVTNGSGSGSGNVTGGGLFGSIAVWFNTTQITGLTYTILFGNVSANLGNFSSIANQVCYSNGSNCAGITNATSRGGNISGGGTTGFIPKFSNSTDLTSSIMQDASTYINVSGNLSVGVGGNNTGNISLAGPDILIMPYRNLGINTTTPLQTLNVKGTANITGGIVAGGLPASSGGKFLCIDAGGNIYTAVTSCVAG